MNSCDFIWTIYPHSKQLATQSKQCSHGRFTHGGRAAAADSHLGAEYSGDMKPGASSQLLGARVGKKSQWTTATLAAEAKELTRTVRAILEVGCK